MKAGFPASGKNRVHSTKVTEPKAKNAAQDKHLLGHRLLKARYPGVISRVPFGHCVVSTSAPLAFSLRLLVIAQL
jgi:hypothetical protein